MSEPEESPTRRAILDGALTAFASKGFAGCAVPEIAEAAGVSVGTLYRYFPSKEALVNELYRTWKQRLAGTVTAHFGDGTAPQVFEGFWDGMADFVATNPDAFRFLELHHHEPYLDDESRQVAGQLEAAILALIADAQSRGEIRTGPPAVLGALVYGAFTGVVRGIDALPDLITSSELSSARRFAWALLDPAHDKTACDNTTTQEPAR